MEEVRSLSAKALKIKDAAQYLGGVSATSVRRLIKRGLGENMKDPFYTYGPPELCSWQVAKRGKNGGSFWIQTSSRVFGRKLRKRKNTSLVAFSVTKRFLETYCMQGSWRKIWRLIDRYISSTGDTFSHTSTSQNALASTDRVDIASPQPAAPDHFCPPGTPLEASGSRLIWDFNKPNQTATSHRG
jgi:hypothetical protein